MTATVEIKWDSKAFMDAVDAGAENVVSQTAKEILEYATSICPVGKVERAPSGKSAQFGKTWSARRPGSLKQSGRIYEFKNQGGIGAYIRFGGIIVDGIDTYYSQIVETKKRFLRRALTRNKASFRKRVRSLF